jgi:hypothetical protein
VKRALVLSGALAAGPALSACSTSSAAHPDYSIEVQGEVDAGVPLAFVDIGAGAGQGGTPNGAPLAYVELYATSKLQACGWFTGQNTDRADLVTLALLVSTTSTSGMEPAAIAPGTYMIGGMYEPDAGVSVQVSATLLVSDATCQSTGGDTASSGTITLTSITAAAVVGRFDVTFSEGGEVTGHFNAPICNGALPAATDAAAAATGDASACHP